MGEVPLYIANTTAVRQGEGEGTDETRGLQQPGTTPEGWGASFNRERL